MTTKSTSNGWRKTKSKKVLKSNEKTPKKVEQENVVVEVKKDVSSKEGSSKLDYDVMIRRALNRMSKDRICFGASIGSEKVLPKIRFVCK